MAESKLKNYRLLAIGGSAGSLKVVLQILPLLKKDSKLAVVIVFHRKQSEDGVLLDILSTKTNYKVKEAEDKDELRSNVIYLAPADYHLLIEKDRTLTLDDSEKLNHSRPSIDATFESAADTYGSALVCLLLSGANADGVAGLGKAKTAGVTIIVQDPKSAEVPYMPQQALDHVRPDLIMDEKNLAQCLSYLHDSVR